MILGLRQLNDIQWTMCTRECIGKTCILGYVTDPKLFLNQEMCISGYHHQLCRVVPRRITGNTRFILYNGIHTISIHTISDCVDAIAGVPVSFFKERPWIQWDNDWGGSSTSIKYTELFIFLLEIHFS